MGDSDYLRWRSRYDVPTTSRKIQNYLAAAGATIFVVIDQQHHARLAGLSMDPLVEILFGNPRAGTPLMRADPLTAFDLPLKVLVMPGGDGTTSVCMLSGAAFVVRYACGQAVLDGAAKLIEQAMAEFR
jgi:uncharacterized protein (DUF302 family)